MAGLRVHFVMPAELVERIDAAAHGGGVSRGEFVRRAVERALEGRPGASVSPGVQLPAPAPAEQPGTLEEVDAILRRVSRSPFESRRHADNCKCPVCS